MRQWVRKLAIAPVMALVLAVGACNDQGSEQVLGPNGQFSESLSLAEDLKAIARGEVPDLSARYNSAIIGPAGGVVYVDLHHLYVPRGAVSGPTKFEMRLTDDHSIGAILTATSVNSRGNPTGPLNNVGSAGFNGRGVYLTFSYAYARNVPSNPQSIKVVYVRDGQLVPQQTSVNRLFRTATGTVTHFSQFALAWP